MKRLAIAALAMAMSAGHASAGIGHKWQCQVVDAETSSAIFPPEPGIVASMKENTFGIVDYGDEIIVNKDWPHPHSTLTFFTDISRGTLSDSASFRDLASHQTIVLDHDPMEGISEGILVSLTVQTSFTVNSWFLECTEPK